LRTCAPAMRIGWKYERTARLPTIIIRFSPPQPWKP
jgi:hypothetical protein